MLLEAGADVVGSNCGQGIAGFVAICRRLHDASGRPVWIKANAGLPQLVDGQTVYAQSAREFADYLPASSKRAPASSADVAVPRRVHSRLCEKIRA